MTVMFMGALVYSVRYTIPEYLCTFLVAGGVSVFALFKVIMALDYFVSARNNCRSMMYVPAEFQYAA
jgi:uncharacterized membrane-anchored protein